MSADVSTVIYEQVDGWDLLLKVARDDANDHTIGNSAVPVALGDSPLGLLGHVLSRRYALRCPTDALLHRNAALDYHADTKNPYPCTNLVVFFRQDMDGGELHFPDTDETITCEDGWVAVFDGQRVHGMTALRPRNRKAFRVSCTFYCPQP